MQTRVMDIDEPPTLKGSYEYSELRNPEPSQELNLNFIFEHNFFERYIAHANIATEHALARGAFSAVRCELARRAHEGSLTYTILDQGLDLSHTSIIGRRHCSLRVYRICEVHGPARRPCEQ